MRTTSLKQIAAYACGAASTLASVIGTYSYIQTEANDIIMSLSAAFGLGLAAYAGWDIAFNKTGWKQKIPALIIALAASTLSSYTIYQLNMIEPTKQLNQAAQEEYQRAKATYQQQQKQHAQQKTNYQQRLNNLHTQNTTDTQASKKAQSIITESKYQKKRADAAKLLQQLQNQIEKRNQRIDQINTRLAQLITPEHPTKPEKKTAALNIPMLLRASLYDAITLIAVLIAGWYRSQKDRETSQHCHQIEQQSKAALDKLNEVMTGAIDLQKNLQIEQINCNRAIAGAKEAITPAKEPVIGAITPAIDLQKPELSEEEALNLIKNKKIDQSDEDKITTELIQKATGWGRTRAKKLLKKAHELGLLHRTKKGRGYTYSYYPEDQYTLDNVLTLSFNSSKGSA